ncbi:MAG: 4-alpha-glucanotransferase [Prevotella sp.]|nr:4-alpha-glucanotransferase [Prevotella sp.]
MNIFFHVDYRTVFGEELVLNVIADNGSTGEQVNKYRMHTADGERWTCEMQCSTLNPPLSTLHYYYSVETEGKEKRHEWLMQPHRLELNEKKRCYVVFDRWIDIPEDSYLYSSAFTECVNKRKAESGKQQAAGRGQQAEGEPSHVLRLVVRAPQLRGNQRLVVCGSEKALGAWNPQHALPMEEHVPNEWTVDVDVDQLEKPTVELKFVALNSEQEFVPMWEDGENRKLTIPQVDDQHVVVFTLDQAFFALSNRRVAGTLVPVFSLRSKDSFGVGDFGDLKKMIEWVAKTGQRLLQVLPINDTTTTHTWTDSYPYSCISIFALHPQYVDLNQLPELKDEKQRTYFEKLRKELNVLPQIDYERVNNAKAEYMRALFEQEGTQMMKTQAYKDFFTQAQQWLVPYAQYCMLRDTYGHVDFTRWTGHEQWNEADRRNLSNPRQKAYREVAFYYFTQFVLDQQMQAAHVCAREHGVILKGDIPIGVSRYGCDVWMEPNYFNMNGQAGAPPDAFSANGQNWGFPTYNWDAMIADGCKWWVRRFQNMSKYFDAYRIDHVLGFFRIWEIPIESVHGLLGQFSPALGMSPEEIEAYGLHFQEELFTQPFIADWTLERTFGVRAAMVKEKFLYRTREGRWALRPEFDTQRKIEAWFEQQHATSQEDCNLRDGLYSLVSCVLFVRDRKQKNRFHPRISAQLDFAYEQLWDNDKDAFNRLYNDYYYRRNNQFWYSEAMKKLPRLVQATRMLVCAEDLGMVPQCVQWVMDELRILSLELQSMPKDPSVRFGIIEQYPYRSVCTISSHDMPTLRMWWDEDYAQAQDFYNNVLHRGGTAPHPMPDWLANDIVSRNLQAPSMLCVLALQDWLACDERIRLADANAERVNIPANPRHYWRYRMHLNLEDLLTNRNFTKLISELVNISGRGASLR